MTTAFQPNAFQNPEVYDHLGFQVDSTGPDPVAAITVDQTVQMVSDQWELALNSSDPWRARSSVSSVDLSFGLINALGDPDLVKVVKEGKVDEWELEFRPDQIVGRMRGRDPMAYALDIAQKISYITGGRPFVPPPPEKLPPGLRPIPGVTTRIYKPGAWRASTVIRDLAERVGLDCSYQAPDYVLREDVEVDGAVNGAIQQIIAPFCNFEPFKVDVWTEGKTLMVRQRQGLVESPGPLGPLPGTLNTVSVHDARITQLMIRAHFLGFIRIFQATGAFLSCADANATDFTTSQYESFDGTNNLRTTVTATTRRKDSAVLSETEEVYNLDTFEFVSRKTTTHTWDALELDSNCKIVNSPLERGSQSLIESRSDPANGGDGAIRQTSRITMAKVYDTDDFLVLQVTGTETAENTAGATMKPSAREVSRFFDNGSKQWTQHTTKYSIDGDGKSTVDSSGSGPASGTRPGGPGRAPKETAGGTRAFKNAIIDLVTPGAKDFSFENPSMTQDAINTIYEQAVASSGAQEYEVQFTAAHIPWIKKGMMLKLTGLFYEDGVTPVDLPNMLVLDSRIIHTESGSPSSLVQVKCLFWSKTYGEGA